jgi:hypothetical protein
MNKAIIDYTVNLSAFISWSGDVNPLRELPTARTLLSALHLFDRADGEIGNVISRSNRLTNRMLVLRTYAKAMRSNKGSFTRQNLSHTTDFHSTTAERLADLLGSLLRTDAEEFMRNSELVAKAMTQPTGELNIAGEVAFAGVTAVLEKWHKAATSYALATNNYQDDKSDFSIAQLVVKPATLMHIQV